MRPERTQSGGRGRCHQVLSVGRYMNTHWLHNNRLHADATALSTILLAVALCLRWSSEVYQDGAGEPRSVMWQSHCNRKVGWRIRWQDTHSKTAN